MLDAGPGRPLPGLLPDTDACHTARKTTPSSIE